MELTKTADLTSNSSPFAALTMMFYDPVRAFAMLKDRRAAWLPLLLTMVASGCMFYFYFSSIDFAWIKEQMLAELPPGDRDAAGGAYTKGMVMAMTIGGAAIAIPFVCAVMGFYYMVAGKMTSKEFTFGQGFALGAWSMVPTLVIAVLGFMQIMLNSNGQLPLGELNPTSLNTLFFQFEMNHPWTGLLQSVDLSALWQILLLIVGFQVWGQVSRATAVKVTLIPYVLVYGLWIAYIVMSAPK